MTGLVLVAGMMPDDKHAAIQPLHSWVTATCCDEEIHLKSILQTMSALYHYEMM